MIQAGKTLSARKWNAAFSPEGYLDIGKTLSRIHRGVIPFIKVKILLYYVQEYDFFYLFTYMIIKCVRKLYNVSKNCRNIYFVIKEGTN